MDEKQTEEAEKLLSYFECHSDELFRGNVHVEWWTEDAAALLRDMLPAWSAFREVGR